MTGEVFEQFALDLPGLPTPTPLSVVPVHGDATTERFRRRVIKTETCWWWDGPPNRDGYGRFWYRRDDGKQRVIAAHVFAWEAAQQPGALHNPDAIRMHVCNHTLCVRIHPSHVVTGTQRENVRYADQLGRRRGRTALRRPDYAAQATAERDIALGRSPILRTDIGLF